MKVIRASNSKHARNITFKSFRPKFIDFESIHNLSAILVNITVFIHFYLLNINTKEPYPSLASAYPFYYNHCKKVSFTFDK